MPSDRDQLDRLIDAALPGYSEAEPTAGFERRIVTYARMERPSRLRLFSQWALAIPALGCLLLFLIVRHNPVRSRREIQPPTAAASIPKSSAPAILARDLPPAAEVGPRSRSFVRPAYQKILPKGDVFPTPSPLTNEERAVVAFSQIPAQLPPPPDSSIAEIDPIHIAELQIKPLELKTLDFPDSTQPNPFGNHP